LTAKVTFFAENMKYIKRKLYFCMENLRIL